MLIWYIIAQFAGINCSFFLQLGYVGLKWLMVWWASWVMHRCMGVDWWWEHGSLTLNKQHYIFQNTETIHPHSDTTHAPPPIQQHSCNAHLACHASPILSPSNLAVVQLHNIAVTYIRIFFKPDAIVWSNERFEEEKVCGASNVFTEQFCHAAKNSRQAGITPEK